MKRRLARQDDDTGLDSLLDTMTNVVGILVLVLIVTQLGVSDKVASIMANSTVTALDVSDAEADLEVQKRQLAQVQKQADSLSSINMDGERQRLARLQDLLNKKQLEIGQQTQDITEFSVRIDADRERAAELEKEIENSAAIRQQLDQAITAALQRRTELASLLDETPDVPSPKALVVRVPNPRPAPAGAQEATFVCSNERLFPLQLENHRRYASEAAKRMITELQLNLDPEAGIDPEKFTDAFRLLKPPDDEFFTAEYYVADNRWPRIRFQPVVENGASLKALTRAGSNMRQFIRTLNPQLLFCRFHVLPDSYEVYIAARRAVTNQELLAGWEPQPENWIMTTGVPGIELGPPRPKPPPPANPPPPAKPPNVID